MRIRKLALRYQIPVSHCVMYGMNANDFEQQVLEPIRARILKSILNKFILWYTSCLNKTAVVMIRMFLKSFSISPQMTSPMIDKLSKVRIKKKNKTKQNITIINTYSGNVD